MKDPKRGAALVIAIAIMTVLLLIALTFFTISRAELKTATNVTNTYRTELIANGALAIAMATLNHDLVIHSTYTSTDHEWKTRFNGAAYAGKAWTRKGGISLADGGVPEINLTTVQAAIPGLFSDPGTMDSLYIPRQQGGTEANPGLEPANFDNRDGNHGFVTSTDYDTTSGLLPVQQINTWADVDNDGDGLKDSIWLPMAADKDLGTDGVDNDLDGIPDNLDPTTGKPQTEYGYFVYYDSVSNRLRLTAPIVFPNSKTSGRVLTSIRVAVSSQFLVDHPSVGGLTLDPRPGSADVDNIDNDFSLIVNDHQEYMYRYQPAAGVTPQNVWNPTAAEIGTVWVDNLGTDNITTTTADNGSIQDVLRRRGHPIVQLSKDNGDGTFTVFTSTGEPVGELVGRYAINITDESSKVNLNATGGRTFYDGWGRTNANTDPIVTRALDQGATTWEYDTRVLPDIGPARAGHLWSLLTGDPDARGFASEPATTLRLNSVGGALVSDIGFPGYGYVDNTGAALWKALSGIDWDGNGFAYDGIIPRNYTNAASGATTMGLLETINGPSQYRLFRPYRDIPAETDLNDNNVNGAIDEIGEMGDRALKTTEQIKLAFAKEKLANAFAPDPDAFFSELQNLITVHSTDKNERHQAMDALGVPLSAPNYSTKLRAVTGLKLDYNYAQPNEIADNLAQDWGYPDVISLLSRGIWDTYDLGVAQSYLSQMATGSGGSDPVVNDPTLTSFFRYALGLKREDMSIAAPGGLFSWNGGAFAVTALPADARLRAAQLAANIKDGRDTDFARSEITTTVEDKWWDDVQLSLKNQGLFTGTPAQRSITYTQAGVENIRINELMVRPVRRIEAEMNTTAGTVQYNPNQYVTTATGNLNLEDFVDYSKRSLTFQSRIGDALHPDGNHVASDWVLDPVSTKYLGDRAYLSTTTSTLPVTGVGAPAENAVQFLFAPSVKLPAGRYYLTVNTSALDASGNLLATAVASGDIRYAIKYVSFSGATSFSPPNASLMPRLKSVGATDILADIIAQRGPSAGPAVPWKNNAVIGLQDMSAGNPGYVPGTAVGSNNATGWVFLPSDLKANLTPVMDGYEQDDGYTVEIPPDGSNIYLCVAVQMSDTATSGKLSVNFFDFSQIPDHQWVELTNIDKSNDPNNAVDLSGWQVQIGVPNMRRIDGGIASPTVLTIPSGTKIAPGGSLLLATDKYDGFQDPSYFDSAIPFPYSPLPGDDLLKINGIGLAKGTIPTAPANLGLLYSNVTEPPIPNPYFTALLGLQQNQVSIFDRGTTYLDFVDRNGDGSAETGTIEDAIQSTIDPIGPNTANKAWDRIVQVDVQGDLFPVANSVDKLAAVVLSGGILPNYPEHDGVDNDGDDDTLNNDVFLTGSPYPGHRGIDEGRWSGLGTPNNPVPGSFSNIPFGFTVDFGSGPIPQPSPIDVSNPSTLPPDWKEFVERRFYPGDCVTVTLYQGAIVLNRVVDKVTYTEKDVVNRSIDDIVPCPYTDSSGIPGTAALNPSYPSFWLDNTMALDFYRSLERKHPLYNGDRFGTLYRWQATDGAYDDWAPSTSRFERVLDAATGAPAGIVDRSNAAYGLLFSHAFSGSPLRMNLSQRYIENPLMDGSPTNRELPNDTAGANYQINTAWAFDKAQVRNRNYVSSGDLLSLPHYSVQHPMRSPTGTPSANYLYDDTLVNIELNSTARQNLQVVEAILGQNYTNDIRAVTSMEVNDSVTLAVGQATTVQTYFQQTPPANWNTNTASGAALPYDWRPVYLKVVDPTSDTNVTTGDPYHYLLRYDYQNATTPPNITTAELLARWPLPTRAVMYVTGNTGGFDPTIDHPAFIPDVTRGTATSPTSPPGNGAEISFTWNGDAGLENGDYDAYVGALDDLSLLGTANANLAADSSGRNYLTDFGSQFVALANSIASKDMSFDLEFLTDKNGDRVAGTPIDPATGLPALNPATGTPIGADESFGLVKGAVPDTDGLIHYGIVRVENNMLKLNFRDWSKRGQLARISRVILTPRNRTPGRININTTETRPIPVSATATDYFNALTGVPGVLAGYTTANGIAYPLNSDNIAPATVIGGPTLPATTLLGRAQAIALQDPNGGQTNFANPLAVSHAGRPVWTDGRYYRDPSDLVAYTDQIWVYNAATSRLESHSIVQPPLTSGVAATLGTLVPAPSGIDPELWNGARFDEIQQRFSRMANLVTTRSDVFEIIVTAQSGYLSNTDLNNDGRIDYRHDFVVTGEKKVRTVYER